MDNIKLEEAQKIIHDSSHKYCLKDQVLVGGDSINRYVQIIFFSKEDPYSLFAFDYSVDLYSDGDYTVHVYPVNQVTKKIVYYEMKEE